MAFGMGLCFTELLYGAEIEPQAQAAKHEVGIIRLASVADGISPANLTFNVPITVRRNGSVAALRNKAVTPF